MPSFNVQTAAAMAANRRARAQEANEPEARGAAVEGAAAAAAAPNEFRIDMNQVLNRLRDFFENIEINFPAAQGNQNNNDLNENNEDPDNQHDDDHVYDTNEYD